MTAEITPDPELIRKRTTHGFRTFENTMKGTNRVLQYLRDGDPRPLEGTRYAEERLKVVDRLTPAERTELGLAAKQRESKPPLFKHKPTPEQLAAFDQALRAEDKGVRIMNSKDQLFMLAVDNEGHVTFHLNCDPAVAAGILHGMSHLLEAAAEQDEKPES